MKTMKLYQVYEWDDTQHVQTNTFFDSSLESNRWLRLHKTGMIKEVSMHVLTSFTEYDMHAAKQKALNKLTTYEKHLLGLN